MGIGIPGELQGAGIICQSAETGHACFWDNILRDDGTPNINEVINWSGQRLVISELKDGSNLSENCTGCHRGNNVYLISPDDPTWTKVLKEGFEGPWTGTFTTQVEESSDNRGGHPRYIPITTLPERPGWENPLPTMPNCSGACHETQRRAPPPPMPPACAASPGGCYRTP